MGIENDNQQTYRQPLLLLELLAAQEQLTRTKIELAKTHEMLNKVLTKVKIINEYERGNNG